MPRPIHVEHHDALDSSLPPIRETTRIGLAQICRLIEGPIFGIAAAADSVLHRQLMDGWIRVGPTFDASWQQIALTKQHQAVSLLFDYYRQGQENDALRFMYARTNDGLYWRDAFKGRDNLKYELHNMAVRGKEIAGYLIRPTSVLLFYPDHVLDRARLIFTGQVTGHDVLHEIETLLAHYPNLLTHGQGA